MQPAVSEICAVCHFDDYANALPAPKYALRPLRMNLYKKWHLLKARAKVE